MKSYFYWMYKMYLRSYFLFLACFFVILLLSAITFSMGPAAYPSIIQLSILSYVGKEMVYLVSKMNEYKEE